LKKIVSMEKTEDFIEFIKSNKKDLPLVMHTVDAKMKGRSVSGKIISIKKYKTNVFSVHSYYKHVTRF